MMSRSSLRDRLGSYGFADRLLHQADPDQQWMPDYVTHDHGPDNNSWRIIERSDDFYQSYGGFRIQRLNRSRALYLADMWHTLLDLPFRYVASVFVASYLVVIFVFTLLYLAFSPQCNLDLHTFGAAWAFSVETIMTIGYGFPTNAKNYFDQCTSVLVLITAESILGCICDALCVGLVFARITRAQTRANTIIFSRHAIIRRIAGRLFFMFQVVEMRKHQLIEAHVRCYAVTRHACRGSEERKVYVRTSYMRLQKPDDELGGSLFMALPSLVAHPIDHYSPLRPHDDHSNDLQRDPRVSYQYPDVYQRDCDVENGNRDAPPVQMPSSSAECDEEEESIREHLLKESTEVIVLVEGIDAVTSDTIQARHSYCFNEIKWHHDFVPCALEDRNGNIHIDFKLMHDTFEVPTSYQNAAPVYLFSDP